jgi:hypothetical protein
MHVQLEDIVLAQNIFGLALLLGEIYLKKIVKTKGDFTRFRCALQDDFSRVPKSLLK